MTVEGVRDVEGLRLRYGDETLEALFAYEDWKRGGMPCAGGLEDQPARWYQIVTACDAAFAVAWEEKRKRDKKG